METEKVFSALKSLRDETISKEDKESLIRSAATFTNLKEAEVGSLVDSYRQNTATEEETYTLTNAFTAIDDEGDKKEKEVRSQEGMNDDTRKDDVSDSAPTDGEENKPETPEVKADMEEKEEPKETDGERSSNSFTPKSLHEMTAERRSASFEHSPRARVDHGISYDNTQKFITDSIRSNHAPTAGIPLEGMIRVKKDFELRHQRRMTLTDMFKREIDILNGKLDEPSIRAVTQYGTFGDSSAVGTTNFSLKDSIAPDILAFAFTDRDEEYGLPSIIDTIPTDSDVWKGEQVGKATVNTRTSLSTDVSGNDQGTKYAHSTNLTGRNMNIEFGIETRSAVGDVEGVLRQSAAAAVQAHIGARFEAAILAAVTAGKIYKLGTAASKDAEDITESIWSGWLKLIKGGSRRVVSINSQTLDIFYGITAANQPVFGSRGNGVNYRDPVLKSLRCVTDDNWNLGDDHTKTTNADKLFGVIGDINKQAKYVINTFGGISGIAFDSKSYRFELYSAWADECALIHKDRMGALMANQANANPS